jgi:Nuclease-related domain.
LTSFRRADSVRSARYGLLVIGESQANDAESAAGKRMRLRYAGRCRLCETELPAGKEAVYEPATRTVRCIVCPSPSLGATDFTPTIDSPGRVQVSLGTAGASARREYQRRRTRDEAKVRKRWGPLGGLVLALSEERRSTRVWKQGAAGEERLARRLDPLASEDIAVLHDRRVPASRANIDHIVVTRGRVWVIDSKSHQGRLRRSVEGWLIGPRIERLIVGARDRTELVDGVLGQVELVRGVVGNVPVTGVLCFTDAQWPLLGGPFTIRGVHVVWPRRLVKLLTADQPGGIEVAAIRELLAARLPPA